MCPNDDKRFKCSADIQVEKRVVGFDAKNKDALILYICNLCTLILRYPCQLNCGHRFCQSCLNSEEGSMIKCNRCNEETPRENIKLDRGCQHDMSSLTISCSLCQWTGIYKNYQEHLSESHTNLMCRYCDEEFISVDCFNQHKFVCEKTPLDCTLKSYGCHKQFYRSNAQDHFMSEEHQRVIIKFVTGKMSHTIDNIDDEQIDYSHTTTSNETWRSTVEELYESVEHLMGGVQALNDDIQREAAEALRSQNTIEHLSEEYSKLKIAIQETNTVLDAHKSNQQILEQNVVLLQQQIEDFKNTSYDGTLLWKITNIQQKIADAQSEKQTSIYSPVFYSSPNGYKMRARLYMTGDGNARRTHMSLFFVLMRGEYDPILQFPFHFKVTFCLFDQTNQQRHIIDSFRPDAKSNSFQRPRSDMNIASGIPKFVPLTIIQQDNNPYVRDDTMFIKIMVDFGNLNKAALPYVFTVNPGLPNSIQQDIIKRELEKRTQDDVSKTTETTATNKSNNNLS